MSGFSAGFEFGRGSAFGHGSLSFGQGLVLGLYMGWDMRVGFRWALVFLYGRGFG